MREGNEPAAGKRPFRILLSALVELDVPGGPGVHLTNLARGFGEIGCDVRVVCPRPRKRPIAIPLERCRFVPFLGFGPLRLLAFGVLAFFQILRELIAFRPDVLYARYGGRELFPAIAARLAGVPLVLQINGPFGRPRRGARFAFRAASGFVANSEGLRAAMLRAFGYPPERSAVVSMHVDTDLFRPLPKAACRAKLGLPRDAWILGYVGTFQPTHEIAILLDVLERIAGAGRDAHLVLVGGGNEEGAWRERARHSPHAERVHFVGAVPHERVPAYVNAFDVGFALLKREKAFAMEAHLKLKEYLACGVPAIVNECDADLFRDYPRGSVLFAPADDPERFTRAVLATGAGDEDGRSREQARAFVAERFNLAEAARRTLAFMRQLVGRQAASG